MAKRLLTSVLGLGRRRIASTFETEFACRPDDFVAIHCCNFEGICIQPRYYEAIRSRPFLVSLFLRNIQHPSSWRKTICQCKHWNIMAVGGEMPSNQAQACKHPPHSNPLLQINPSEFLLSNTCAVFKWITLLFLNIEEGRQRSIKKRMNGVQKLRQNTQSYRDIRGAVKSIVNRIQLLRKQHTC